MNARVEPVHRLPLEGEPAPDLIREGVNPSLSPDPVAALRWTPRLQAAVEATAFHKTFT